MIGRRQVLGLTVVGVAAAAFGPPARACSIVATNLTRFNDRKCRQAIVDFVALLNDAPSLADDDVSRRADSLGFNLEPEWVDDILGERSAPDTRREYTVLKEFRLAGGRLDPKPIEVEEINLIRRLGNRATYQFTLKRYSYHPADPEGCNGLFVHDEYYGVDRRSCLATLSANRLKRIRRFPEWYLEDEA